MEGMLEIFNNIFETFNSFSKKEKLYWWLFFLAIFIFLINRKFIIKVLRKPRFNILEATPKDKKIALIINGDVDGSRHEGNVNKAIETLYGKGFRKFITVTNQTLEIENSSLKDFCLKRFPSSIKGADEAFLYLKKEGVLKEGLLFLYSTGHGYLQLSDICYYPLQRLIEELKTISEKGVQIIAMFDGCGAGLIPTHLVNNRLKIKVFSLSEDFYDTVYCQFYSPKVFTAISENIDFDNNGFSEPHEWHKAGLLNYNKQFKSKGNYSEYEGNLNES